MVLLTSRKSQRVSIITFLHCGTFSVVPLIWELSIGLNIGYIQYRPKQLVLKGVIYNIRWFDSISSLLLKTEVRSLKNKVKNIELTVDSLSAKEVIDLLNELNEKLERAKTIIDELAQKKIDLELNLTSVSLADLQGGFLPEHY